MSADDCFLKNKNIVVIIISILVHINRKNSESCFLLFVFRKYNLLILLYI